MATLEELVVRLDADITPLKSALKQADGLIRDFAAAAARSRASRRAG